MRKKIPQKNQPISIKLHTQHKDLQKIFKQALKENNFPAALKAKELQLKFFSQNEQKAQFNTVEEKLMTGQELYEYFQKYSSDVLKTLNEEIEKLIFTQSKFEK